MKRFVVFDFSDTLAELVPGRCRIVAEFIAAQSGLLVREKDIAAAYRMVDLAMPYSSVHIRSDADRGSFYRRYNTQLLTVLGVAHCVDPAGLMGFFKGCKAHWQLKPGALETLITFHELGYGIGILSNFDACLKDIVCNHLGLGGLIDYLHVSQSEGLEKPDTGFYRSFFARHGIPIESAAYIGDSYLLDFLPASEIGLDAWLLDEQAVYPHLPRAIRSIREFPDAVLAGAERSWRTCRSTRDMGHEPPVTAPGRLRSGFH